ncbi:hypothetical protein AA0472_0644 [Acetobacter estunensis NRIC 0472]|nr:hypothetical protein AA0472_0644 [Acetobacter estunensis NRIC 0472]
MTTSQDRTCRSMGIVLLWGAFVLWGSFACDLALVSSRSYRFLATIIAAPVLIWPFLTKKPQLALGVPLALVLSGALMLHFAP